MDVMSFFFCPTLFSTLKETKCLRCVVVLSKRLSINSSFKVGVEPWWSHAQSLFVFGLQIWSTELGEDIPLIECIWTAIDEVCC
jgi:hypothetical protein